MDNPPPLESQWKLPSPHNVLSLIFAVAVAVRESGAFPEGSIWTKISAVAVLFCGLSGVAAARMYLSPRVQSILQEHDACPHPKPEEVKTPDAPAR